MAWPGSTHSLPKLDAIKQNTALATARSARTRCSMFRFLFEMGFVDGDGLEGLEIRPFRIQRT